MTTPQPNTFDVLIDFVSAFFVPMFLADSNGNIALAQLAAIHTMNAYRVKHQADLLDVAQIVAFGFATLSSLSLSMADDISLSMILRLRGNANACNRSAEQNRRALQASHQAAQTAYTDSAQTQSAQTQSAQTQPAQTQPAQTQPAQTQPAPAASGVPTTQASPPVDTAQAPAAPLTTDQQRRAAWAAAFIEVADEYTAELPNLPPAEQNAASIRVAALNSSASALLSDIPLPQGASGPSLLPNKPRPQSA